MRALPGWAARSLWQIDLVLSERPLSLTLIGDVNTQISLPALLRSYARCAVARVLDHDGEHGDHNGRLHHRSDCHRDLAALDCEAPSG